MMAVLRWVCGFAAYFLLTAILDTFTSNRYIWFFAGAIFMAINHMVWDLIR